MLCVVRNCVCLCVCKRWKQQKLILRARAPSKKGKSYNKIYLIYFWRLKNSSPAARLSRHSLLLLFSILLIYTRHRARRSSTRDNEAINARRCFLSTTYLYYIYHTMQPGDHRLSLSLTLPGALRHFLSLVDLIKNFILLLYTLISISLQTHTHVRARVHWMGARSL